MKRAHLVSFALPALTLAFVLAMPSNGNAQAIGKAMGNLRWGMSDSEVTRVVKTRLADQYAAKMKSAKGAQKTALERELTTKVRELQGSLVEFNRKGSRWDRSEIAGEFAYGTGESMMTVNDGESDNYYFFLDGRLWKWVKLYPSSQFGGKNFSKFSGAIEKKFGKGYKKEGELNAGTGKKHTFLEMLDRNTRLRAVDRTGDANKYALVFEEMATVRQLASIRPQTKKPARLAAADDEDEVVAAKPQKAEKQRRSVFAGEGNESESAYEARQKSAVASKREAQRKAYEREQEMKKGKALDSLQGVDDDDPLAGMN